MIKDTKQDGTNQSVLGGSSIDTSEEKTRYFIDLNWFEENERSFFLLAQGRMCSSCQERLGEEEEERVPVFDAETGKAVSGIQKVPYGSNPFEVIASCCSQSERFITRNLPLLELVFRIFLSNHNQQLDVEQICGRVKQCLTAVGDLRDVSPEMLQRLLNNDRYYGLRRFIA